MSKIENPSTRRAGGAKGEIHVTPGGAIRVERLAPTVVLHTVNGVGTMGFYRPIVESCEAVLAEHGKLVVLIDSWDQVRIETDFREALTKYLQEKKNDDCSALMLVQSKLIQMAMSVMNMLTGRSYFETFANVEQWERRCREHFPGLRRHPIVKVDGGYV